MEKKQGALGKLKEQDHHEIWAKREGQIERVMGATVGMYGDLQGIAGKSLRNRPFQPVILFVVT
ncbi:MAG: hypothetical protein AABY83_14430 [Pseudomonadota bacterium]